MRRIAGALALCAGIGFGPAMAQDTGVVIQINLDEATARELQTRGEWVVVTAWYYGDPVVEGAPLDEMGLVYLGEEEATIYPVSQTITLGGFTNGAPRDWVEAPIVNVNVYTARMTDQNNLLNCGLVEGVVADLAGTPQVIDCTMLGQ